MERCPQPAALEAFATGSIAPEHRGTIEQHLDRCPDCAGVVGQLANLYGSASLGPSIAAHSPPHLQTTAGRGATTPHRSGGGSPNASGIKVGRYELGRRLGAGGMGVVFEATDPELRRQVAIKLLHPSAAADPELTRARLLREARAMARLAHPNVVAIHDVGRAGEQVFVAMEMIEGSTLTHWLAAAKRTPEEILAAFAGAGAGLAAAHEVGLVHRDFKPDNVLVGVDGRARVTDFGLATPVLTWSPNTEAPIAALGESVAITTAHGSIVGTPAYMAPEQWRGEPADARSDQFSFCVALFEALGGVRPFVGTDWITLSQNVLAGRVRGDRSLPRKIDKALRRGLQLSPQRRHRSMQPLLALLTKDRSTVVRVAAIAGGLGFAAAASVGVLAWMASETNVGAEVSDTPGSNADGASKQTESKPSPAEPEAQLEPESTAHTRCTAKHADVDGVWSPTRRKNLEQRLAKAEHGTTTLRSTNEALDRFAERFAVAAERACAPDAPDTGRRWACLEDHAGRLDGLLTRAMVHHTFRVTETLAVAAHALPDPGRCADDAWLASWPVAPEAAPSTDARMLTASIAAAEADLALLEFNTVENAGPGLLERANALGDSALSARAELVVARSHLAHLRPAKAIASLDRAASHAEEAEAVLLGVDIANAQVEARGVVMRRPSEAEPWQASALAVIQRMPAPSRAAESALLRGEVLRARLELRPALAELDKALELYTAAFGAKNPRLAEVLTSMAQTHVELGDHEAASAAATRGAKLIEDAGGLADLRLGRLVTILAHAALLAGDLETAAKHASRADGLCAGSSSLRHDFARGDALIIQARIDAANRDATATSESLRKAAIYHYQGTKKAEPLRWRGILESNLVSTDVGLESLGAAVIELSGQLADPGDPRRLEAVRALGLAQIKAGQRVAARKTLDWAAAMAKTHFGFGAMTARATFDLAKLERAEGNEEKALELYDDAHVPWVSAFGMKHPSVTEELLARADLAFSLGKSDYAGRLYRTNLDEIEALFGTTSPEAARARTRKTAK